MNIKKYSWIRLGWYLAIFAFLYIWFSRVHPLVVYDADDWTYLAYVREAVPLWGDWNPGKVFPEFMMPALSSLAYYCLYPLTGDYIGTFTVFHAVVVSGFITVYVWCFDELLGRIFSLDQMTRLLLSGFFLLFHFLALRGREANNMYLFHCVDLNCYYNYLIPAVMNASAAMLLMKNKEMETFVKSGKPVWKGFFWLAIYFTIFSNLAVSGILASFAGARLLLSLLQRIKEFRLQDYLQDNRLDLTVFGIWIFSALFELTGGRAGSSGAEGGLLGSVSLAAYCLKEVLYQSNRLFWVVVAVVSLAAVICCLRSRGKGAAEEQFLHSALLITVAGAAILVYTLLLCAVVDWEYMFRGEYLLGMFFYGFLLVLLAAGYLLKRNPELGMVLPLLLVVLCSTVNTNGQTFLESNKYNVDAAVCADISRDILEQVVTAAQSGEKEMTLYVPYHVADPVNEDNWPHTLVLMHRISGALYNHGIIREYIYITEVCPTLEMNREYGLPIPEGIQ